MKLNDFIKNIGSAIKLDLPQETLSKLDIELPENFDTEFSKNYLTRDRAKNDDEIITEITKKANKKGFTEIDEQLKELLSFVSDEHKQKINSVFSTAEKAKLLKPALDDAIQKSKGKVTPEDVRKVEDEWNEKYKALQDQAKAEKEALVKQMEDKNFDFYATSKLAAYTVAEPFKGTREQINAMGIMALKQKGYVYEFENGSIAVRQIKDGVARDVYDGDKKVTFESLVDSFMNPFIAKSAGSGGNGSSGGDGDKVKVIQIDGKEDLHSLMHKNAAAHVSLP